MLANPDASFNVTTSANNLKETVTVGDWSGAGHFARHRVADHRVRGDHNRTIVLQYRNSVVNRHDLGNWPPIPEPDASVRRF